MLASKVSRPGSWLAVGCLAFMLGASAAQAINWWPFKKKVAAPPQPVQVLGVSGADTGAAPAILQFWDRNTLIIDLQAAGGTGNAVLSRPAEGRWPMRISFRAVPGQFGTLEVRGAQRAVLSLRSDGPAPALVALDPTVWTQQSAQLELSWGSGLTAVP
jgi:hypothetical protein